jgi:CBS domain containing-hemolysin-like protein
MGDSHFGYRLLLVAFILAANAFFSGSEVALLSARRSRLRQLADEGQVGAQAALSLLANPERLLSVVQVGVTLASLGLGWAGEETVFRLIVSVLGPVLTPATSAVLHAVSFAIAFLLITFAHVVIGEVVPKNLALENAERLAALVAPPLLVFARVSAPFVYAIERTSIWVSRLMGLKGEAHAGGHSAEEIKYIVSSSRSSGHLVRFEESAIQRILELQDYYVREIMVPRNDVVAIPINATLDEVLRTIEETQFTRYPVFEGARENIVGVLHVKDLVRVWDEVRRATERRRYVPPFSLRRILRKPVVVPETKPLPQLVEDLRDSHTHLATVVDEFGTIVGIVTLEDALEQIVGEIEDEFDVRAPAPQLEASVVELEGATSILDLEAFYGIELPADAGFETLAGFLLYKLGSIPNVGYAF